MVQYRIKLMTSDNLSRTADCEIISTRVFKAPIDIVYRSWSDPGHIKNWWGPAGFTNTIKDFDFRMGGKWSFIMHGPDKGNYPNECEFIKIEEHALIAWKRYTKPIFTVVVKFEEISAKETRVVFKMLFDSADECNKLKGFAPEKNQENFDRLELELARMMNMT